MLRPHLPPRVSSKFFTVDRRALNDALLASANSLWIVKPMATREVGYFLIVLMLALSLVFQTQLKLYALELSTLLSQSEVSRSEKIIIFMKSLLSWRFVLIGVMAAAIFSLYLWSLTILELSVTLSLVSVGMAVNALGGDLVLGQTITPERIVGVIVVAIGVVLVVRS